ncbi:MAG TPA: hypothetical protein VES88_12055 [Gemmatimonadaceae bacterium]|nr:hypothetical protein [Gemmatimonadaceae bacterium]
MQRIADDIVRQVGSEPFAVVATHRHRDHISGFATAANHKGTGDKIRACNPKVVVQPWTEDPALAPKATGPSASDGPTLRARGFTAALSNMHGIAEAAVAEAQRLDQRAPRSLVKQLAFLGQNNLANASAVKNLMTMGAVQRYVHFGSKSGLERFLPGVKTRVLGPPTLEQSDKIGTQRSKDQDEFWHLQALAQTYVRWATAGRADASGESYPRSEAELFPDAARLESRLPPYARWFVPRIRALRAEQMLGIVRSLDDALNNTSVILLFEVRGKKFLFPGDAQIENWQFALSKPAIRRLLRKVDFYKVGHHGSLNATPKTLWNLFERKTSLDKVRSRLRTAVSTMKGKHGDSRRGTEVPRRKLIEALEQSSNFTTTQTIKASALFEDISYEFK